MRATHEARHRCHQDAGHLARNPPLSAFFGEVVGDVGASPLQTVTSPPRTATSLPANGGNCAIRAATRRRHAEDRLLMVQNLHQTGGIAPLEAHGRARPTSRARPNGRIALHEAPGAACLPMTPPANGGNCTIRAATRRRHAEERLLMVQNPQIAPASGTAEPGGAASVPGGRPWPGLKATRRSANATRTGRPRCNLTSRGATLQHEACCAPNFACNPLATCVQHRTASLELQRFRVMLKVQSIELHAKMPRSRPNTAHVDPIMCAWVLLSARGRVSVRLGSAAHV